MRQVHIFHHAPDKVSSFVFFHFFFLSDNLGTADILYTNSKIPDQSVHTSFEMLYIMFRGTENIRVSMCESSLLIEN